MDLVGPVVESALGSVDSILIEYLPSSSMINRLQGSPIADDPAIAARVCNLPAYHHLDDCDLNPKRKKNRLNINSREEKPVE